MFAFEIKWVVMLLLFLRPPSHLTIMQVTEKLPFFHMIENLQNKPITAEGVDQKQLGANSTVGGYSCISLKNPTLREPAAMEPGPEELPFLEPALHEDSFMLPLGFKT